MPFVEIPGLTGKVYVPEHRPTELKKHDCRDCFSCQMCGDDRCAACRSENKRIDDKKRKK